MKTLRVAAPRAVSVLALAWLLCFGALVGVGRAESTPKHQKVVDSAVARLLAKMEKVEGYDAWPPKIIVQDNVQLNAYASIDAEEYRNSQKKIPIVLVTTGLIEVLRFDEDQLAYVIGHEMGHHALLHVLDNFKNQDPKTALTKLAFRREHELDADQFGMQLALKAGYSYRKSLEALARIRDTGEYSSFEEAHTDHPNWVNRIEALETDDAKKKFWQAMSAFENGVFFLLTEQYINAQKCFLQVTRDFPNCYEGWANLGYARLMEYCDKLDPKDLKDFELGHLVVGGFYRRPGSLEADPIRGKDERLWRDAVEALKEAIRLKPDSILAKANLAVAYLVDPIGKDVGRAAQLYDEIAELMKDSRIVAQLDPLVRATLLLNSGVVQASGGLPTEAKKAFDEVANIIAQAGNAQSSYRSVQQALVYNYALAFAGATDAESQRKALAGFEQYLANTPSSLAWWQLAYDRYVELAGKLGVQAHSVEEFNKVTTVVWRQVTSVQVGGKESVGVSQPMREVNRGLGEPESSVPVVGNLRVMKYPKHQISVLGTTRVLAIILDDPQGPAIEVRRGGLGAQPVAVRVGMSREELEKILGGDKPMGYIIDSDTASGYRFYYDIGVAVKIRKGKVVELVIAPLPRQQSNV